jgi:uncharacterized coiled-coil protein SlyX
MNSGDIAGAVVAIIFFLSIAATFILRGPLGRALARRIEGTAASVDDRVLHLEQRVAELEHAQARIPELEERVDFAERMLTRAEIPHRLPAEEERR